MVRAACVDKTGVKRGAWSEEEDHKLRSYVLRYGHWNWRLLPKYAGLNRCGKSCRLRWMNYLKPGVKRGDFTREEGELVKKLHDQLGNKWSAIAAQMPGRTDNEIKNFWHTHFNRGRRSKTTHKSIKQSQAKFFPEQSSSVTWKIISSNSSEILYSGRVKREGSEASSSLSSMSSSSSSEVYILDTSSCSNSSNSGVSEGADDWDLDSFMEQICPEMQLPEPSDSLDFKWDDGANSSSSDSFSGLIQESFMVDTSYIQELGFPLFEDSDSEINYYNQSLGFDDNDLKLF